MIHEAREESVSICYSTVLVFHLEIFLENIIQGF